MEDVASDFEISRAALYKHRKNCLPAGLLADLRASEDMSAVDLLDVLREVLGDLNAARAAALLTGRVGDVVRASAATTATAAALLDRLGVSSTSLLDDLREWQELARAVAAAIRDDPRVSLPIAAALRARGQTDAADALQRVAQTAVTTTGVFA